MWLNVTECHWCLELQMAFRASLRCFRCCNTNCYATIKTFPPPGINWPLRFSSTGPEIPTTQCIALYTLLSRDDFKCVENLESWKITCTCKAIDSISQVLSEWDRQTSVTFEGWLTGSHMSHLYSSTYNDGKQDSYEGTECIPILICICGPESGNWVVDRLVDESNRDTPARYAEPPTSP